MKIIVFFILIFIYSCSDNQSLAKKNNNVFYDKAFEYQEKGKLDSAFLYFYRAKDLFIQQKDNFGAAKCLTNLAIIQETKGDYFGSQETALSALKYLNPKDTLQHIYLSINNNTIGITASKLKDYKKAVEFYQQALKFTKSEEDKIIYQNNLANNYAKEKKYTQAINLFIYTSKMNGEDKINYARTLTNLAKTKWLQNPDYNPVPEFQKALNIRIKEKDNWGLNSSYSHLADYYARTKTDSALFYSRKMYEISKEIDSPDDQIEALQKLISLENPEKSKQYFKIYQKIGDSLQTARNKAKNQFALIRYETEKNKADFLKAKAESTERQNYIIQQYFALGFSVLIIIGFWFYLKRSRKILRQEKLIEVKNTELKYSKKVHDRVANRIYQIMSQVENTSIVDRNALLFGLENVYETSRDISYENKDINENQNFFEQLQKMLDSYSSDFVKVIYNGNYDKLWDSINFQTKTEIYLILQEMMTNMKKHSKADKVFLKFERQETHISISYTDNGIGIEKISPKNGLQNMENRIHAINGKIIFDTETKNLLKINISFPV
ncbi:ATP-binding protein [Epilithonimonas sp. UC225_85]|uniref:tetratricopeptide repeat-containing sensor histidine kinase n=1 Tax=Epilithonimonas sp. UC225_85 TaxID=3350167 RepID=UPI0036D3AA5B